jgi:CheY-like chemotaxis protein
MAARRFDELAAGQADDWSQHSSMAAEHLADAASRAKTALLANMSHDLRTPVSAMLGMADLLAETGLNPDQRRFLGIMINNGSTLLGLVDDMLDLARADSGRVKLERAEFNLIELSEGVVEAFAPQAHRKGLELAASVAADVPPVMIGDERRLRQILMNLIGNAIKFTPAGEVAVEVKREAGALGMFRFTVIDSGIGIDPADHQRIFASYAKARARTALKAAGSGLGLAIVKQIAELMDGSVWVESQPGAGSSFHCSLRMGYQPCASLARDYGRKRTLAGRRIMIIAGGKHSRAALMATIRIHGASVVAASSAEEAIELIGERPGETCSTVLFDWPAAKGGDAAAITRIKAALPPSLALLPLLPIHDRVRNLAVLQTLGINRYLLKPARRAELVEALRESSSGLEVTAASPWQHHQSDTAEQRQAEAPPPPDGALPLRILAADDEASGRILIEAYLNASGCQLDQAENGIDAVKQFVAHPYDVVLMDLRMPEMDGYAVVRRMREWEQAHGLPRTPIIALTAAVLDDAVRESLAAGCDRHLSKPVKRTALFAALREVTAASNQAVT